MDWISVTEKMPKASDEHTHDDDVLLYIPPHDRPSIVKGGEPIHFDGGIYLGHPSVTKSPADEGGKSNFWGIPIEASNWIVWGYSYFCGAPKPTHWMPLPDKPNPDQYDWSENA